MEHKSTFAVAVLQMCPRQKVCADYQSLLDHRIWLLQILKYIGSLDSAVPVSSRSTSALNSSLGEDRALCNQVALRSVRERSWSPLNGSTRLRSPHRDYRGPVGR